MKRTKEYPSQEYLRSILDYNPETGIFIWKHRKEMPNNWNGRFAGAIAGEREIIGYITIVINYKKYRAHKLAYIYMTGELPEYIDHKDLDGFNNKWDNLRQSTRSQNQYNRRKQSNNTSGFKGVSLDKERGKWIAQIVKEKKHYHLGRYNTKEAAFAAYKKAQQTLHGEFARVA